MAVEVFTVNDKQAFIDVRIVFQQRRGFERGERLTAAGGMPDIAVAAMLLNAIDNRLDRVDLIRAHDHQLLLAGHQHHITADHLSQRALCQETLGKIMQMVDFCVVFIGQPVNGQKAFIGVEAEMFTVIVGEVEGVTAVADNKKLYKAQQLVGVAVAGVVFVFDDLPHGAARCEAQGFQFDLHHGHAVDQQDHIVTVMAVGGVDTQLVDDFKVVFAPVADIDQRVLQRGAVVALKGVAFAQDFGRRKDIRLDYLATQPGKFRIRQFYPVERREFLAKILFQRRVIANVRAIGVFLSFQPGDQVVFYLLFCCHACYPGCACWNRLYLSRAG